MPSPKRHGHSRTDYKDDEASSDDGRHHSRKSTSRPRGYGSPRDYLQRDNSLVSLRKEDHNKGESDWDTDYDPRDKYYLSEEDDPLDLYSPTRKGSVREDSGGKDRNGSSRHRSSGHGSSSRHSHSQSHSRSHRHSHSHSHSRDNDEDDDDHDDLTSHRKAPSSSHSKAGTHTASQRSRPKPSRAGSSYLSTTHHHRRPRAVRTGSSYKRSRTARPPYTSRSTSFGGGVRGKSRPKSTKAGSKPWEDIDWQEAAKVAMQAGTVAAIKVGSDSVPWPVKGTKIASAALGAAVVDHVLKPKKKGGIKYTAMRHLAEVAVGNLVVGPALGRAGGSGQRRKR